MDERLIDAQAAAHGLGWTVGRLRVWRHRNPGILEPVARGKRGVALFRYDDLENALTSMRHADAETARSA